MTIDMIATEPQFADHLAPVWHALPEELRGVFIVPIGLAQHARGLGLSTARQPHSDAVLVASWGDHQRARRLEYAHIARIEHGIGQSFGTGHPSYAGGRKCEDVSLFLTPNEHSAALWRAAYPGARVEVVGCPKVDAIPTYQPQPRPLVVFSFHWNGATVPEAGSAFADFRGAIPALRERDDIEIALHGHPKAREEIARWAMHRGIRFIPDFVDVLRTAALYVCDGVSTLYEFAATGRPVVVVNAFAYRPHVSHGLRFWDAADVGIQVDHPSELDAAISSALEDRPAQQRRRASALRKVYAHRGTAARRAASVVASWVRQPAEAVA